MEQDNLKTLIEKLPEILTSAAAFVGAVGGVVVGLLSYFKSKKNGDVIADVSRSVNGEMVAKLATAHAAGHAEGVRNRSEKV